MIYFQILCDNVANFNGHIVFILLLEILLYSCVDIMISVLKYCFKCIPKYNFWPYHRVLATPPDTLIMMHTYVHMRRTVLFVNPQIQHSRFSKLFYGSAGIIGLR